MANGRKWEPEELAALKRHYPRQGSTGVQRILAQNGFMRTIGAINSKANQLQVRLGESPTLVPLNDVHAQSRADFRQASAYAVNQAKRDGVLVTVGSGNAKRHMVPSEWAEAYAAHLFERENAERVGRDWLSSREAAEVLGVSWSYLVNNVNGHGCGTTMREILAGVRCVRAGYGRGKLLWHPDDCRLAAARLRAERKPVGWNLERAA
jgi:hypothetical protein